MRARLLTFGIGWTLAFAAVHVYWASGGTVGVPAGTASIGSRPVFLVYDLASAAVFVAAAFVARRLRDRPTAGLVRLTSLGAIVALVRGVVGLAQDGASLSAGKGLSIGMTYDVWFVVAAVVFLGAVHATGTTSPRSPSVTSPVAPARTPRRPSTTT